MAVCVVLVACDNFCMLFLPLEVLLESFACREEFGSFDERVGEFSNLERELESAIPNVRGRSLPRRREQGLETA